MSVNFFNEDCCTTSHKDEFGICDGTNNEKAFLDFDNKSQWICKILNRNETLINFRAIDYCIVVLRPDGNQERSCDCMLTYPENIVFIELKNKGKGWIEDGIEQIEKTLTQFMINHTLDDFKHKRAFVSNRKHPNFHVLENETMRRFYTKFRVRLNIQAEIIIK